MIAVSAAVSSLRHFEPPPRAGQPSAALGYGGPNRLAPCKHLPNTGILICNQFATEFALDVPLMHSMRSAHGVPKEL